MSLSAHYKLNDDATDSSGNGLDGVATDVSWVAGKIGNGGSFNGSTSKVVAGTWNITSAQFSISAWFYDAVRATASNEHFVSKWKANSNYRSWLLSVCYPTGYTGNIAFGVGDLGTNWRIWSTENNIYSAEAWHHVVATYDAGSFGLYLDGVTTALPYNPSSSGAAPTGAPHSSTAEVWLGGAQYESGGAKYFNGLLDDIRVYDEVLSLSQAKSIWASGRGTEVALPWAAARRRRLLTEAV